MFNQFALLFKFGLFSLQYKATVCDIVNSPGTRYCVRCQDLCSSWRDIRETESIVIILTTQVGPENPVLQLQVYPDVVPSGVHPAPFLHGLESHAEA